MSFGSRIKRRLMTWGKELPSSRPIQRPPAEAPDIQLRSDAASRGRPSHMGADVARPAKAAEPAAASSRDTPYLIQIGFDYGTSFSKCICRDLSTNRAWIHVPVGQERNEYPFLIPGSVHVKHARFVSNPDPGVHYPADGLFHLKLALERTARGAWTDPVLGAFKQQCGSDVPDDLRQFVVAANVYFLAQALAGVRHGLVARYGDFGANAEDIAFVNMAIPVADASSASVMHMFESVLEMAWRISADASCLDACADSKQVALGPGCLPPVDSSEFDPCFIYPEISANVQGFVRSRSAAEGTYLFTDVGAGTVDQSTFVFLRRNGGEWLTYLHSTVLPLGSSQIERRAARIEGDDSPLALEAWRKRKEQGVPHSGIDAARLEIGGEMGLGTHCTLGCTMKKLYLASQLEKTRLLFGGGGFSRDPYELAVRGRFGRPWFAKQIVPDVVGMPLPRDLELDSSKAHWMRRLYVAYGLSFFRSDLSGHTFPDGVKDVAAKERRIKHDGIQRAPRKDDC